MLDFSGRGAAAKTACEVPAITGSASEGASRRNRRSGSAARGWGRELNLRHCHPGQIRMERYRDSEQSFRPHSPQGALSVRTAGDLVAGDFSKEFKCTYST